MRAIRRDPGARSPRWASVVMALVVGATVLTGVVYAEVASAMVDPCDDYDGPCIPEPLPPWPPMPEPPSGPGDNGGGGGGSGGNPNAQVPNKAVRQATVQRALTIIREALRDHPECGTLIDGSNNPLYTPPPGYDALNVLNNTTFRVRDKVTTDLAEAFPRRGAPGGTVDLFLPLFDPKLPDTWGRDAMTEGFVMTPAEIVPPLSGDEVVALIMIHELGHMTGTNPHEFWYDPREEWHQVFQFEFDAMLACLRPGMIDNASPVDVAAASASGADNPVYEAWLCARGCSDIQADTRQQMSHQPPAVAVGPNGRLNAFAIGDDGTPYHASRAGLGQPFSAWTSLGGWIKPSSRALVAATNADGTAIVFGLGGGDGIYYNRQQTVGGPFTGWQGIAGGPVGTPPYGLGHVSVARNADGRLELFASAPDRSIYHAWQTAASGPWTSWYRLGTRIFDSTPQAVVNNAGRIEVYANVGGGPGQGIYRAVQCASVCDWQDWTLVSSYGTHGPVLPARNADGRIELFTTPSHSGLNRVYHAWEASPGGAFSSFEPLGNNDPSWIRLTGVTTNRDGTLEVYGTTGQLAHRIWQCQGCPNASWSNWMAMFPRSAPIEAAPIVDGLRYTLSPRHSGKCLDIDGASTANGWPAKQFACHYGPNQQFRVEPAGGDRYRLVAVHSNKCVDVIGANGNDGAYVGQWDCSPASLSQQWTLMPVGNGAYELTARHSEMCLAVANNWTYDGQPVIQENCGYDQLDEHWVIAPLDRVTVVADHSNQCLEVSNAYQTDGAQVQQWPCVGVSQQKWWLVPARDGYALVVQHSNKCLDGGGSTANNAPVVQWGCHYGNNQRWWMTKRGDGTWTLTSVHSRNCLAIADTSTTFGAPARQVTCTGATSQRWRVTLTS